MRIHFHFIYVNDVAEPLAEGETEQDVVDPEELEDDDDPEIDAYLKCSLMESIYNSGPTIRMVDNPGSISMSKFLARISQQELYEMYAAWTQCRGNKPVSSATFRKVRLVWKKLVKIRKESQHPTCSGCAIYSADRRLAETQVDKYVV